MGCCIGNSGSPLHLPLLTLCSYHVTYAFQSKSTLYSCLILKELLARNSWVFVYELSGCGFESRCSHINLFVEKTIIYFNVKTKSFDARWTSGRELPHPKLIFLMNLPFCCGVSFSPWHNLSSILHGLPLSIKARIYAHVLRMLLVQDKRGCR